MIDFFWYFLNREDHIQFCRSFLCAIDSDSFNKDNNKKKSKINFGCYFESQVRIYRPRDISIDRFKKVLN